MAYQLALCKNDRCTNVVGESKNSGVKKLYCHPACARRHHSRMAYQREAGNTGDGMLQVDAQMRAQLHRRIPASIKIAETRFKAHLDDCMIARRRGGNAECPARFDVYDRKKLCLIHAVFNDDWAQMMAAADGRPAPRGMTTIDGHWLSDVENPELAASLSLKGVSEEEAKIDAFIAAGGGVPPVPLEKFPWDE